MSIVVLFDYFIVHHFCYIDCRLTNDNSFTRLQNGTNYSPMSLACIPAISQNTYIVISLQNGTNYSPMSLACIPAISQNTYIVISTIIKQNLTNLYPLHHYFMSNRWCESHMIDLHRRPYWYLEVQCTLYLY
jgi:hypothetical protein